jgi:hypothetical protein
MKLQVVNYEFGKALATLVKIATLTAIVACRAAAMDSNCTQVGSYATNHIYRVWIPAANFGYTPWQINPTVAVWDRCDHGAIALNINLYNSAVQTKPGGIVTVRAFYYIPGRGWIPAAPLVNRSPAASGWLTFTYDLGYQGPGHVDLCRSCRITQVGFVTSVWTSGNGGSGWVGLATKTLTLNLLNPAWNSD